MLWILQFVVRFRILFTLLLTVLCSLIFINAGSAQQQSIARTLSLSLYFPFQFTIRNLTDIRNIYAENNRLKEQVALLSITLSRLAEQSGENDRLRELLNFQKDFTYDLLPVRIVAREPSPLSRSMVINAGTQLGLQRHMPLVTQDGIIGKIIQVMPGISLVQTLNDPLLRTSVMVKRTRIVGIMETENGRSFFVRHHTTADVAEGDTVVTSGLGGVYPKGLTVGIVRSVEEYNDPMFHTIGRTRIKLTADFNYLEEAFVVRLEPRWSALQSELDSLEFSQW